MTTSFYPDGAGPGIAEMLDEGYRAVSIPIEHISAVQGFARPGTFVDVLFRSKETEDRPEVTITLLERVKVLAVNKNTLSEHNVDLDKGGAVTLAVTPLQAKALKVVEARGELSLTLRNPNDELDFMPVDLNRGEKMRGIAGDRPPRPGGPARTSRPRTGTGSASHGQWPARPVADGHGTGDARNRSNQPERSAQHSPQTEACANDGVSREPRKKSSSLIMKPGRHPQETPQLIRIPVEQPIVRRKVPDPSSLQSSHGAIQKRSPPIPGS